jgi:hypothetical protein
MGRGAATGAGPNRNYTVTVMLEATAGKWRKVLRLQKSVLLGSFGERAVCYESSYSNSLERFLTSLPRNFTDMRHHQTQLSLGKRLCGYVAAVHSSRFRVSGLVLVL